MPKMRLLNPERLNIGNQIPLKLFRGYGRNNNLILKINSKSYAYI
jgi:hypothetical protein